MNGMDAGIPIVLFQGVVIAVAGTTETLKPLADGKEAGLRWIAFGHRRQEIQQQGVFLLFFMAPHFFKIHIQAALQQQAQGPFDHRSLKQQHPFHIGVFNDGHRRICGVFLLDLPALFSEDRIFQGSIVGGRSHGGSPDAHPDPRFVHHLKHVSKPVVGITHQIAPAIVSVTHAELRGGAPPVTQFVKNSRSNHIV